MNVRQRKFADLVAQGIPGGRAYEQAGYTSRGAVADVKASQLVRVAKVKDYLYKILDKGSKAALSSREEIRETLLRCIRKAELEGKYGAVSALTDKLNKMDQNYAPKVIEVRDNRPAIAERVRLVGPLIADKIEASQPDAIEV